ncbi:MAG: VOC family protein [Actinomycetota bacterium]|nr:VOC family protein [Actinomycetota bacterium]
MPQNPPEGYPAVMPYLYYEDAGAALKFLTSAFGFTEKFRMEGENGRIEHAEVEIGDKGVVMLGEPGEGYTSPKSRGGKKTESIYVYVDDVDAHFSRAKEAGATIVREVKDQFYGDRNYGAEDLEGHEWYFGTHVKDLSPEEFEAATADSGTGDSS